MFADDGAVMVLRSTRQTAVSIAGTIAGLALFLAVIALLLGTPLLILGLVPLLLAGGLSATFLSIPVSVSTEGGEVVLRSGRSEKHFERARVARCCRNGATWIFTDSTGARLFTLNGWVFDVPDVASFCGHAGVKYDGPSPKPTAMLQREIRSLRGSLPVAALGGIAFTVFMVLSAWTQHLAQADLDRYRAAPECAGQAASTCRLETQARVISVDAHSADATVSLTLVEQGGDYLTRLPFPSPKRGDVVAVEVWGSRITLIGERATSDNPANNPNVGIKGVVVGFGLFAAACFGLAFWMRHQLVTARTRLRAATRS